MFLNSQDLILRTNCITLLPGVHYYDVICNSVAQTPVFPLQSDAFFHLFTVWQK